MRKTEFSEAGTGVSQETTVVAAGDIIYRKVKEETVILNTASGVYCGLNEIGSRIWESINEPRDVKGIVDIILDEYDVEPGRCERDVCLLLQDMLDNGLIEVAHP